MLHYVMAFTLMAGVGSTESSPIVIEIPEPAAILFPAPEDSECIAVGRSAVYRVSAEGAEPILHGSFQLNPEPLMSSNGAILALLDVKANGMSEVVILSLKSGAVTRFERQVKTRKWTWFQPDASLLLINEAGLIDDFELLEFNLKTLRMDVRMTASNQVCDLLTASPGGEYFLEVIRTGADSASAQTFVHRRENQSESFVMSSGVSWALWLDERRFLAVAGRDEMALVLYTISREARTGTVEEFERLFQLEAGQICEGAALSPRGDYAAIGVRDNSPAGRYEEDAREFDANYVRFIRLPEKSEGELGVNVTHQPWRWEQFSWSPNGLRFAHATERVYAKPPHTIRELDRDSERDYPITVLPSPSKNSEQGGASVDPLYISPDPVTSLCWSRDASTLFALTTPMGDARIVIMTP